MSIFHKIPDNLVSSRKSHIWKSLPAGRLFCHRGDLSKKSGPAPPFKYTKKAQLNIPQIQKYLNVGGILIVPLKVSDALNCPVYLLSEKFCLISASFQVCSFVLVLKGVEIQPRNGQIANVETRKCSNSLNCDLNVNGISDATNLDSKFCFTFCILNSSWDKLLCQVLSEKNGESSLRRRAIMRGWIRNQWWSKCLDWICDRVNLLPPISIFYP